MSLVQELESFAGSDALQDLQLISGESEALVKRLWLPLNESLGAKEVCSSIFTHTRKPWLRSTHIVCRRREWSVSASEWRAGV